MRSREISSIESSSIYFSWKLTLFIICSLPRVARVEGPTCEAPEPRVLLYYIEFYHCVCCVLYFVKFLYKVRARACILHGGATRRPTRWARWLGARCFLLWCSQIGARVNSNWPSLGRLSETALPKGASFPTWRHEGARKVELPRELG